MCTEKLYLRVNAALLSLRRAPGAHQRPLNTEILNDGAACTEGSSIRIKFAKIAPPRFLHKLIILNRAKTDLCVMPLPVLTLSEREN